MFVYGNAAELGQIDATARPHHGIGERGCFIERHAAKHNRHEQRCYLIVRPRPIRRSRDERPDGITIERIAIAFSANDIHGPHGEAKYSCIRD